MEGMTFTAQEMLLPANALLFLYTDGLTEATDQDKNLFGKKRVEDALRRAMDEGLTEAAGYVDRMIGEVAAFVKEAPQADDLTMLAIRNIKDKTLI